YIPIAVPARLALVEERWFPPSIATSGLGIPQRQAEQLLGVPLVDDVHIPVNLRTLNSRPPTKFDAGGVAFRLAGTGHEMDWSISHYTGPETGPNAELETSVRCRNCPTALPKGLFPARARSFLRQDHDIIHMT